MSIDGVQKVAKRVKRTV